MVSLSPRCYNHVIREYRLTDVASRIVVSGQALTGSHIFNGLKQQLFGVSLEEFAVGSEEGLIHSKKGPDPPQSARRRSMSIWSAYCISRRRRRAREVVTG